MDRVNPELISRYADGQVTPEEALQVEAALAEDPSAALLLEELLSLEELFGNPEPEEISAELRERLVALRPVAPLETFQVVPTERHRRIGWLHWAAAAAALLMVAVGVSRLAHRPEIEITSFARLILDADGNVIDTRRPTGTVKMRAGDALTAAPGERLSMRLPQGATVVLQAGGRLHLGDPRDGELFELDRGTALCTVSEKGEARTVEAAGFLVHVDDAHFGVRVEGKKIRSAGPSARSGRTAVTVAVSRGRVEVGENGARQTVEAYERVILRRGAPVERSQAWKDPLYAELLRTFQNIGREIVPGFFSVEHGVTDIPRRLWQREPDGARVLVVTDSQAAMLARYLVLHLRADQPTKFKLTRVRPYRDRPGLAETVTVETAEVGPGARVVALPRDVFDNPPEGLSIERKDRKIPAGRSRLVRLELRPATAGVGYDLKASLWAARPPADQSEEDR